MSESEVKNPSEKFYPQVVVVMLAAGAARRFGRPKQLERWPAPDGPTLVERATRLALNSGVGHILVVVGNQAEAVTKLLQAPEYQKVRSVYNPRWEEGQGFSVAVGVQAAIELHSDAQAILFMLSDQPRLQPTTLTTLLDYFSDLGPPAQQAIIFPTYDGRRGNPVIFGNRFFEELARLEGDSGGRTVVRAHPQAAQEIAVTDPAIHEDVDTPADLARLDNPQTAEGV